MITAIYNIVYVQDGVTSGLYCGVYGDDSMWYMVEINSDVYLVYGGELLRGKCISGPKVCIPYSLLREA